MRKKSGLKGIRGGPDVQWCVSSSMETTLVVDAQEQAL
ncbi:hypothetical protein EC12741_A0287 [Escherichia coli 1.2741]|nr:hypothetical protein EC12741_A0287 [Escherichia coli 1.2741]